MWLPFAYFYMEIYESVSCLYVSICLSSCKLWERSLMPPLSIIICVLERQGQGVMDKEGCGPRCIYLGMGPNVLRGNYFQRSMPTIGIYTSSHQMIWGKRSAHLIKDSTRTCISVKKMPFTFTFVIPIKKNCHSR